MFAVEQIQTRRVAKIAVGTVRGVVIDQSDPALADDHTGPAAKFSPHLQFEGACDARVSVETSEHAEAQPHRRIKMEDFADVRPRAKERSAGDFAAGYLHGNALQVGMKDARVHPAFDRDPVRRVYGGRQR